jgi:bZIP transcription factor
MPHVVVFFLVHIDQAARESRRRKKVMIEELQRSVIFFSRANGTLKQQNDELTRLLMQAQGQVSAVDGDGKVAAKPAAAAAMAPPPPKKVVEHQDEAAELAQANAVATQAMYESQGFPAAAARAAAQTMNFGATTVAAAAAAPMAPPATHPLHAALPAMQPGATMQAMANFQQAAAAAMQAAMGQMQEIPGLNTSQLAAAPAGTNAQQAYTDTMTALAMQQAAASAGQQFLAHPGMHFLQPVMNQWQQQQAVAVQQAQAAQKPAPTVEQKKEE